MLTKVKLSSPIKHLTKRFIRLFLKKIKKVYYMRNVLEKENTNITEIAPIVKNKINNKYEKFKN
jgi:hypothetical protein